MHEGFPSRKEKIPMKPESFDFNEYFNEFVGYAMLLKSGLSSFDEVLKKIKEKPLRLVEDYLSDNKDNFNYEHLCGAYATHPKEIKRLNDITEEINSLKEDEETKFRELIEELHDIVYKNGKTYF